MCRTSIYEARNNFSTLVKLAEEDWLMKWRKTYENELDDIGLDLTPSLERPDYSKDPWV